jgi:hypothetical protein
MKITSLKQHVPAQETKLTYEDGMSEEEDREQSGSEDERPAKVRGIVEVMGVR